MRLTTMKLLFFAVGVVVAGALAQKAPSPAEREAHWLQDLQVLSNGLKAPGIRVAAGLATRGQKDFAEVYPNFDAEMASIREAIPNLSDAELYLRLSRLIASAHIAHNTVDIPMGMGFLDRLPVEFHWFSDGLAVSITTTENSALLGARVRTIGGTTPEQFLADLKPYVSYENETWLRVKSEDLMPARGVLQHFGMIGKDGNVPLELEKTDGEVVSVSLPLAPGDVKKIAIAEGLRIPPVLYRSHPNIWYWTEYLADSQTIFIQYNQCANDSTHHFGEVVRQAMADADSHSVKRVVIDLRWNGGGDSSVINPLMSGLNARRKSLGKIYVLIGPYTFSSAVNNVISLKEDLGATVVGEASGGMPDGYGEVKSITLPNSKLVVGFSTKHWGAKGDTGPKTVTPDLPAPGTLAEFLAGHDPALDAAIHDAPTRAN